MSSLSERKAEAKEEFKRHLKPDEEPLWFDGFFLIVTNERVLSFRISSENLLTSGGDLSDSYALRLSIPLGMVSGVAASPKKSPLGLGFVFSMTDGSTEFVGCPIATESVEELRVEIEQTQKNGEVRESDAGITRETKSASGRLQRQRGRERVIAEMDAKYGPELVTARFASLTITIFGNGYVRISALLGLVEGAMEELLAISGDTDITKKTGVGRVAGAILTNGLNLGTPNQRGNVYLTISTNVDTYAFVSQTPDSGTIANMQAIVSAGTAALARAEAMRQPKSVASPVGQPLDLSVQLRNLAELKSSGLLTDEEFAKAKAKLLES